MTSTASDLDVLQVIAGKGGHGAEFGPGRRKGAALIAQHAVGGGDRAVALRADFHVDGGGACGARGREHFIAGHGELHRAVGLARKGKRQGFGPDMGFAAEAAADFGSGDAQLGHIHAQQLGAVVAVDEVALGADPQLALAIGADIGNTGMGLDIALVGLLGLEGVLDDDIGLPEALLHIAMAEFRARWLLLEGLVGLGSTPSVKMSL